jgi:hypothetical protein|nr:MAG TPA: hypothetical protein [Caudoviricetes sp.]DAZ75493.1 MAG TPA: hypothetical protein [Caudoviricetes sp.]
MIRRLYHKKGIGKMAKMKNHDCPLGVSYVAIKTEKKHWKEIFWKVADTVIVVAGLMMVGAALALWLVTR